MSANTVAAKHDEKKVAAEGVILLDPLTDPRWDSFVEKHPFGKLAHTSNWKRVLEDSFANMKGYYLALEDQSGTALKAALPLFERRGKLSGHRLVSIPHATLCDPLVSSGDDLSALIDAAVRLQQQKRITSIEVRSLDAFPLLNDNRISRHHFLKNHYIDLNKSQEELFRSFHRTCVRQRISRAENSDLRLVVGQDERDLASFLQLFVKTRKRLGFPPQPYRFFTSLWQEFGASGKMSVLLAKRQQHILSGLILFKYRDRVSAEFLAWDTGCRDVSPNHFLFWERIKAAHSEGYSIFDFGATSPNNTTLMEFKKHWGTKIIDITHCYYPHQESDDYESKELSIQYKLSKKICPYIPDSVLIHLGSFFYNYL